MNINKVTAVFYSPTGTSAKIAKTIAMATGLTSYEEIDLTLDRSASFIPIEKSLTVIAAPVYSGRVSPVAAERIKRLKGDNSSAIIVAVYGNRDYDDALVELYDTVAAKGFKILSAAVFIGEHSFSRHDMPVAEGRPDASDLSVAHKFGQDSMAKLREKDIPEHIEIKGNRPYRLPGQRQPVSPVCTGVCTNDGICIGLCPTGAIYFDNENKIATDSEKCTLCCACVKRCPNNARIFNSPFTRYLYENCSVRKEPEIFF